MAQTIFYQLASLLAMALVGWALTKAGSIKDEGPLNAVLVNAALPALILHTMQTPFAVEMLQNLGIMAVGMVVVVGVGCLVGFLVARAAKKTGREGGAWMASAAFPNAVYMGQPLIVAIYGQEPLYMVSSILLVFNISVFTVGGWLLSQGTASGPPKLRELLLRPIMLTFPLALALYFMPFRLPLPVRSTLEMLSHLNTPLSMMTIGSQLAKSNLREIFGDRRIYILSFVKLIAVPLACYPLLRLFIADPVVLGMLMIVACMPSAAFVSVVARDRGGDVLLCSKVIFTSTLLCVATVPLLLGLLLR